MSGGRVEAADGAWRKGIGLIYHRTIRRHLEGARDANAANQRASQERLAASKEFQELLDFPAWQAPSPARMESFISEKGFMDETIREWISDYQHFVEVGEIRRRDLFTTE